MRKTIVITGAGAGLGRALARRLAADGNHVVLLGRTMPKLLKLSEELGERSTAIQCDVASPDSVRAAFVQIAAKFPQIDVLINNAGIYKPFRIDAATDEEINSSLMINLAGPIYCCREALRLMQKGAHIINVSSDSVTRPYMMFALYQSTKAGLERFTKALQAEILDQGIRVTMIRPGAMVDQDTVMDLDPERAQLFMDANSKAGFDFFKRPISSFASAVEVFRTLIYLPEDVHVPEIEVEARHS